MSCRQHGYHWPSLATSPDHSSPPAGLLGYIPCPHIAAVCKFWLVVLLLLGRMCLCVCVCVWISKHEKHLRLLSSGTKFFLLPLSLKVLRQKDWDTHSFCSGFFIHPPPISSDTCPRPLRNKRKPTLLSRCPVLNSTNFLQNSKILHAILVRDVIPI